MASGACGPVRMRAPAPLSTDGKIRIFEEVAAANRHAIRESYLPIVRVMVVLGGAFPAHRERLSRCVEATLRTQDWAASAQIPRRSEK